MKKKLFCICSITLTFFAAHQNFLMSYTISPVEEEFLTHSSPLSIVGAYTYYSNLPESLCDIGEHLSTLKTLSAECAHVIEIGVSQMKSTWGILQGLSENPSAERSYLGIDVFKPSPIIFNVAQQQTQLNGISFNFLIENDLNIMIESTDLLFIDSLHTYCHLTYELETFSPQVRKYIALHDTSAPWGDCDDVEYTGDYTEYPLHINRQKKGLWPAVVDFLSTHPEWQLINRYTHCHGFTILKRVSS